MTTNNLKAIKAILNVTLNNFNAIRVEGTKHPFTDKLVLDVISIKSKIAAVIEDIDNEVKAADIAATEPEFK